MSTSAARPTAAATRAALVAVAAERSDEPFDPTTLRDLPAPARRHLRAAVPAGTPLSSRVDIEMDGRIKLGVWLPFTARQVLVAGAGFVWEPVVGGRVLRFVGADSLGPDGARMRFRLHGRIDVVDESGPDVARSAAGRLAAETVAWLPQALTPQAGAEWRPVDDTRAVVVVATPAGPVPVEVTVDGAGIVRRLELQRWQDSADPPRLVPFGGHTQDVVVADGVRIAGRGSVGWDRGTPQEESGVFFRYAIRSVRFG